MIATRHHCKWTLTGTEAECYETENGHFRVMVEDMGTQASSVRCNFCPKCGEKAPKKMDEQ